MINNHSPNQPLYLDPMTSLPPEVATLILTSLFHEGYTKSLIVSQKWREMTLNVIEHDCRKFVGFIARKIDDANNEFSNLALRIDSLKDVIDFRKKIEVLGGKLLPLNTQESLAKEFDAQQNPIFRDYFTILGLDDQLKQELQMEYKDDTKLDTIMNKYLELNRRDKALSIVNHISNSCLRNINLAKVARAYAVRHQFDKVKETYLKISEDETGINYQEIIFKLLEDAP